MVAVWLVTVAGFWVWWIQPDHMVGAAGFVLTTAVLMYQFLMPAFFLFFLRRAARPHPALEIPPGLRVAFATTFVPGAESIDVLERTVTAMRDQRGHRHDVWVLDEGDDPAVKKLCTALGIYHFSRKGRKAYQSQEWPFKAKTKAGNYNSWLHWARRHHHRYDVLIQMDTDHVPQPGYMVEMLQPFADPGVAYVAAPSITSGNAAESWSARARCELEATLHGALQMGYNFGWAPLIIGSHAAFRVSALASIGGFQHTLAEDHHNTLRLNASGYRGIFNPDAIAIGDGAASFAEAMLQEYQWARALTQILLNFLPQDIRRLPPHLGLQFVFAETWYPLFALTQAISYLTPVLAIATGQPLVSVNYWTFLAMFSPSVGVSLLIVLWARRQGWLRPYDAAVLSWRSILLTLARWPFVTMAVGEAVLGRVLGRDFAFRVTVKGVAGARALPLRVLLPYLLIIAVTLAAIVYHLAHPDLALDGYARLALLNAALYVALVVSVVLLNARENRSVQRIRARAVLRMHLGGYAAGLVGTVCILLVALPSLRIPPATPPAHAASAPAVAGPRAGGPTVTLPQGQEFLGVYDPTGVSDGLHADAQEIFVDWSPTIGSELTADLAQIEGRQRVPFVTIQPYPWNIDGLTAASLLTDISSGRYDGTIRSIAAAVASVAPDPVYVRFAQEMDLGGDYPWAGGDPSAYIAAYRHFTTVLRASGATNSEMVWSPTGNPGSTAYYPGSDYVDMVGTTLLVASVWDASEGYSSPPSFEQALQQRYSVLAPLGKPIVIAEMAASLQPQSGVTAWLAAARRSLVRYPLVRGMIYFDAPEPPMPHLDVRPDWMLSQAQLQEFLVPLAAPDSPLPTATPTPVAAARTPRPRPTAPGVRPSGRNAPGWLRALIGSVARAAAGVVGWTRALPVHTHAFSLSLDPDPPLRAPPPEPDRSGGMALHPSTAGSHSLAAPTARRSQ